MDTNITSKPHLMRVASGDSTINKDMFEAPIEDKLRFYNKEYITLIRNGYMKLIDSIIEDINNSEDKYPLEVRNKVQYLMTSLILNADDVKYIKTQMKTKAKAIGATTIIPNITELDYLSDIPYDYDIVERVYRYLYRLVKGLFVLPDTPGGDICVTGVVFDNQKDFNEVFQTFIIENDKVKALKNSELTQDIDAFNRKNRLVRERMIEILGDSKGVTKDKELELRRKYKFDPDTQSFQKRKNPINKKIIVLLADKNAKVFEDLYKGISEQK